MWLVPLGYLVIGIAFVLLRRGLRGDAQGALDVLFVVVFWPMHAAFVDDAGAGDTFEGRLARFRAEVLRLRRRAEAVAQTLSSDGHDCVRLEQRVGELLARGDHASAEAVRLHLVEARRALDAHRHMVSRLERLEALEHSIALQLELVRAMPREHDPSELALLLADAEAELGAN